MGGQTVVSRLCNNDLSQVDEFSQVWEHVFQFSVPLKADNISKNEKKLLVKIKTNSNIRYTYPTSETLFAIFKLHKLFRPSFGLIILVITKLRISLWYMNPRLLKYSHFEGEKIGFLKYFVSFTGRMRSYLKCNDSAFLEDLRFKKHKNNENIMPVEWQSSLQKVEILIHGRFPWYCLNNSNLNFLQLLYRPHLNKNFLKTIKTENQTWLTDLYGVESCGGAAWLWIDFYKVY